MTNGDVAMIMSVGGLAQGVSFLLGKDFLNSGVNLFGDFQSVSIQPCFLL